MTPCSPRSSLRPDGLLELQILIAGRRWLQWLAGQEGVALGLVQAGGKLPLMPAGMPTAQRAPLILRLLSSALDDAAALKYACCAIRAPCPRGGLMHCGTKLL